MQWRRLCNFTAALRHRRICCQSGQSANSPPPCAVVQFQCQTRHLHNFAAALCPWNRPLRNFIAALRNSGAKHGNGVISLPPCAAEPTLCRLSIVQFHFRLAELSNFTANGGDGTISLTPWAAGQFHCQCRRPPSAVCQLCNFIAASSNSGGAASPPPPPLPQSPLPPPTALTVGKPKLAKKRSIWGPAEAQGDPKQT